MEKILEVITQELMVLLIAAMPLMELRGAIPIGVSLGMHPLHATLLGIAGSLLPVPFLLLFVEPMIMYLKNRPLFKRLVQRVVKKTLKKTKAMKNYKILGLIFFVALPLPGTGVWTGCLAAILFHVPFKYAFPAIALGTSLAGGLMFILSYIVVNM